MRIVSLLVLSLIAIMAKGQIDPNHKVYFGLLHAHTLISDGSGTPVDAYRMARQQGLHFFALTEHNHEDSESGAKERKDGVQIATTPALYNGNSNVTVTRNWKENGVEKTEQVSVKPLIKAAAEETTSNFIALYGQEFSTISSSNHLNVFGVKQVLTTENGNISALLNYLSSLPVKPVIQLNHPDVATDLFYKGENRSTQKNMFNDYGIDAGDLGPHFKDLVAALDPYAHLIEILSGPAMKKKPVTNYHYRDHENDYYFYLKQGFHISPSAGQDNHYKTWGKTTDARVGIVTTSLSETNIYEAMRLNRTFATEDKNLKVILYINDQLMGGSVTAGEETELKIQVFIEDGDEEDAEYEINLYAGEINPELSTQATDWKATDGLVETVSATGNGLFAIPSIFCGKKPEFYYVRIEQDGTDLAWTAPVWVNEVNVPVDTGDGQPRFFWTVNPSSKVYHIPGCVAVGRIKPENLMSGTVPPVGRTLHSCVVEEDDH